MGAGSSRDLMAIVESVFGTLPTTPTMKKIRNTGGAGIKLDRSQLLSKEIRGDRAISVFRLGNRKPSLEIPIEFSYTSYRDYLEALLCGTWSIAYNLMNQSVTVVASTKKFSRASGSWVTDGVKVGDSIVTTGFEDAGNNGTFLVSAVDALEITCATASGLVNVSGDTGVRVTTTRSVLRCGTTLRSFSIQEAFTDISVFAVMKGSRANRFSLNVQPDQPVTGSFQFLGKDLSVAATTYASATTGPDTTDVFDSYTGSALEAGSAITTLTGIQFTMDNGGEQKHALYDTTVNRIPLGRTKVSGTVTAYFESKTLLDKFLAETETSLTFTMTDLAGNAYRFTMPKVKYSSEGRSVSENDVIQTLGFQALHDATRTTLEIEELPAAA